MPWTTPRTWTSTVVTAAQLNTDLRDNENFLYADRAQSFRGLHLRSHPDSDIASSRVALLGLDDVTMDTGARYSGLTLPLVGNIDAAGAAGLDTGAKAASTWYEAWLIGKSSTNAASDLRLLLHKAKVYTLDQSQLLTTNWLQLRSAATTAIKIAQGFKVTNTGLVEAVDISLLKTGAPTGNIWLTIEADSSGNPSGTPLATSQKINVANTSTTATVLRCIFQTPASLTGGTQYHLVLQGDYATSATVNVGLGYQNTDVYANGQVKYFDGTSTWSTSTWDAYFRIYVTAASAAVTMPSGWDQKTKLGYVYNSAGNVLQPFIQHGKRVVPLNAKASGTFTATVATLFDLSAVLPPCPVLAKFALGGTYSSAQAVVVGGVPDGFVAWPQSYRGGGVVHSWFNATSDATIATSVQDDLPTQNQAVYASTTGNTGQFWLASYEWLT